jgi:hypothetical protein
MACAREELRHSSRIGPDADDLWGIVDAQDKNLHRAVPSERIIFDMVGMAPGSRLSA